MKKTAVAIVTLEVAVEVPGTWGSDCTVEQIDKQATESALGALRQGVILNGTSRSFVESKLPNIYASTRGDAHVRAVIVENVDTRTRPLFRFDHGPVSARVERLPQLAEGDVELCSSEIERAFERLDILLQAYYSDRVPALPVAEARQELRKSINDATRAHSRETVHYLSEISKALGGDGSFMLAKLPFLVAEMRGQFLALCVELDGPPGDPAAGLRERHAALVAEIAHRDKVESHPGRGYDELRRGQIAELLEEAKKMAARVKHLEENQRRWCVACGKPYADAREAEEHRFSGGELFCWMRGACRNTPIAGVAPHPAPPGIAG